MTLKHADVRVFIKPGCLLPGTVTPQQAVPLVSIKANLPCSLVCGCWRILLIVLKPGQFIIITITIDFFSIVFYTYSSVAFSARIKNSIHHCPENLLTCVTLFSGGTWYVHCDFF